jgi:AraC-like DNA-binding protein
MTNARGYAVNPGWRILLQDLGLSPENILRRADLPGDLWAREKATLSSDEYFRLWLATLDESGDPTLPLKFGAAISVEVFDPPIFAALCSPNLNTALERLAHYKPLIAPMALNVSLGDDATSLEIVWLDKTIQPPPVLVLTELVFFVQVARLATRTEMSPLEVWSPHVPEKKKEFADYFGVAVRSGDSPRLLFSKADATRPFLTSNPKMWEYFEPGLNKRLAELDQAATASDRVHAALLELLPSGSASMESVCKRLGTSSRTLQRRLRQEGKSFQTVLNTTREKLANHYLRSSRMTGAEISFLLGFEDPNSFFRAFSAWTGKTPEQVRSASAVMQ